jgi:hypothetical protein
MAMVVAAVERRLRGAAPPLVAARDAPLVTHAGSKPLGLVTRASLKAEAPEPEQSQARGAGL